jgi:hypothetical protein
LTDDNLPDLIGQKITHHLKGLDSYKKADKQKQLELCQIGKFLATFFPSYDIKQVREEPDFIITNGKTEFGLEHEVITNTAIRKQHGFYENIFHLAERDIQSTTELPNFLANCYLKSNLNFKTKDKSELIQIVKEVVSCSILKNEIPENPIIDRIVQMPHSKKNLTVNFGAHMVQNLSANIVYDFIKKKEDKIKKYSSNTGLDQWLILLAGGGNEYSYNVIEGLNFEKLDTQFQKVFLLADFDNKLYQIK